MLGLVVAATVSLSLCASGAFADEAKAVTNKPPLTVLSIGNSFSHLVQRTGRNDVYETPLDSWKADTYQPYADQLIKVIREFAPTAKIVVHQTGSYNNLSNSIRNHKTKGPGSWGIDQTGMYERLAA